ncbi:uncharacterized protein CCOS01_05526 [Colletotrichum costaricense]|uniref:Uncharacterized protein n=2 Tax=Colletotrichum acutatum species complex TaxID=2707335 RepID=A0AAI9Z0N1_9PEZI|nr:uncharacterized protein CCOS01_05526 [Colletotrichum costaricense]XP_060388618.1 uncharacterized protein CTAM01_01113 [Colletotrichum tamarilloi]KAI3549086.1 hypothetical protein CSPX01_02646 [Colletotrichum filicis]KAK1512183.1 hypothetical protein CTAM01_01113 [Colletotrichum tamarilloi]KAK1530423.1 hypothetical protein CCOS01_05526 [Colletotrichum costaricense]
MMTRVSTPKRKGRPLYRYICDGGGSGIPDHRHGRVIGTLRSTSASPGHENHCHSQTSWLLPSWPG